MLPIHWSLSSSSHPTPRAPSFPLQGPGPVLSTAPFYPVTSYSPFRSQPTFTSSGKSPQQPLPPPNKWIWFLMSHSLLHLIDTQ